MLPPPSLAGRTRPAAREAAAAAVVVAVETPRPLAAGRVQHFLPGRAHGAAATVRRRGREGSGSSRLPREHPPAGRPDRPAGRTRRLGNAPGDGRRAWPHEPASGGRWRHLGRPPHADQDFTVERRPVSSEGACWAGVWSGMGVQTARAERDEECIHSSRGPHEH